MAFFGQQFITWCLIAVYDRLFTTISLYFLSQKTETVRESGSFVLSPALDPAAKPIKLTLPFQILNSTNNPAVFAITIPPHSCSKPHLLLLFLQLLFYTLYLSE